MKMFLYIRGSQQRHIAAVNHFTVGRMIRMYVHVTVYV